MTNEFQRCQQAARALDLLLNDKVETEKLMREHGLRNSDSYTELLSKIKHAENELIEARRAVDSSYDHDTDATCDAIAERILCY